MIYIYNLKTEKTDKHTDRQIYIHPNVQIQRQTGIHTAIQTGRENQHLERQTDIHT